MTGRDPLIGLQYGGLMAQPRAIVLRAPGTNCDEETAAAWERAGAVAEAWHVGRLIESPGRSMPSRSSPCPAGSPTAMTWAPAGSWPPGWGPSSANRSGGSTTAAGWCWGSATASRCWCAPACCRAGRPPGRATLARNDSGRFESRWVRLGTRPGLSPFISARSDATIELPVAHGEGRFVTGRARTTSPSWTGPGQIVLKYADAEGRATEAYPENPNGSPAAVAGVCDPTGRIFGLMPHPERFIDPLASILDGPAARDRPRNPATGSPIFTNAVRALEA